MPTGIADAYRRNRRCAPTESQVRTKEILLLLARHVLSGGSVAKDYTGLVVWQLAAELRIEILKLTRTPALARDFRLRSEMEETVSSICRNIPEGFRRRTNREFARFLEYSYASSGELKSLFEDAQIKNRVTAADLERARALRFRLDRALVGLMRHLRKSAPTAPPVRTD